MKKFLLSIFLPVIWIVSIILVFQSCAEIRVENYYLPKGFEGNVAVIYTTDGIRQEEANNWKIPGDGLLRTPYEYRAGNYYINYYQVNSDNKYDTLQDLTPGHTPNPNKNMIVFPRTLSFSTHENDKVVHVTTFYVGRKTANELEKDRFFFERRLGELLLKQR